MITTINNKHNKLNFSNEREQSQTCLNSAEHEKNQGRKVLNVPNLRFPEFEGEWEEERLADIADLYKGTGISKDQLSDDGEPCILYGELYTKYKSETIREVISKTNIDNTKLVRSKANDVIIPCSGETAEDIATARCVLNGNILLGGDLNIIRLHGYDGAFMSYQLNGRRKYDIAKVAQGVSVVHLYGEHLKGVKTINPCLEEQKKIAKLLSLLDERIATQNKIIDKLQSLIKGIAHKLFQTARTTKPLLEFAPNITSGTDKSGSGTIIPLYGSTGIIGTVKNASQNGNIVLVARVGTIGAVQYVNEPCGVSDNALIVEAGEMTKYIYHFLKTYNFARITSGTTQPLITASSLKKVAIPTYDIESQTRIVLCLNSLEKKLDIAKQYLSEIAVMKQYLLRQMFI